MIRLDLIGQKFNELTVLAKAEIRESGGQFWVCKCDCGVIKKVSSSYLRRGRVKSCGCLQKRKALERNLTHGQAAGKNSPESLAHCSWRGMLQRCNNPNAKGYHNYGGRGITVCPEWHKFENFYRDMGDRPIDKTLDRININLGYFKSNCKWSTLEEQAQNQRPKLYLTFKGQSKPILEWSNITGIPIRTIYNRIYDNWTIDRALSTPQRIR